MNDRPPIVILAALESEYRAVRARLAGVRDARAVAGTRFEIGTLDEGEVVLGVTGQGTHSAAVLAERAIRTFSPTSVLFAGVAGRLRPDIELGDVVVATYVYAYHGAAARSGGLRSRPRVWEIPHALEQAARHIARREFPPGAGPQVHFGPVASGEVLHDAEVSAPLAWIREHYEDALAIEMEAAGVAKAGQLSAAPVAVIRAISDRADGTKTATDRDGLQARAAGSAAAFALALAADVFGRAGSGPEVAAPTPGIHVDARGGSHGAVAGVVNGGVHNTVVGRPPGPARTDRGRC